MKYNLTLSFNGLTFKKRTDNLAGAILALKPEILYTEVYASTSRIGSKNKIEKRLSLFDGKKLFLNEDFLKVFVNNLET
jgi:hypothetical protein